MKSAQNTFHVNNFREHPLERIIVFSGTLTLKEKTKRNINNGLYFSVIVDWKVCEGSTKGCGRVYCESCPRAALRFQCMKT